MIKRMKKKHSKYFKIYVITFIIGIVIAILFINNLSKNELNTILINIKKHKVLFNINNNSIDHLKILSVILVLSFIYIGMPLFIGLLISESFKISLKIILLTKIFKTRGFIYGVLYNLINGGLFIVLSYFLFKRIIRIFKKLYLNKFKGEILNYNELYNLLIKTIFLIILIFISDLLIYFYGNNVLSIFKNICKA
ncbi:MAG: hypothetical protein J5634_03750 [Bacilli bacterium]|nr:hypothetical protein [Bacilli bacterium]